MPTTDILVFQLKVTLKEIDPAIWRRFQVRRQVRLDRLHLFIQACMGWTNSHLHEFRIGGQRYTAFEQMSEDIDDFDTQDEKEYRLKNLVNEGDSFEYLYDFGDCWEHEVLVEKLIEPEAGVKYPVCVEGKRACPPEDCGGPWRYNDLLRILGDSEHEEYADYREWAGEDFDPEKFDLEKMNDCLRRV